MRVAPVRYDWCPLKKRKFGGSGTLGEDNVGILGEDGHSLKERNLNQSPSPSLQKNPALPTPWSLTSSLQTHETAHFIVQSNGSLALLWQL